MNDTIAAISTSPGIGAISIIRVSGKDAIKIANKIFVGADLEKAKSHTIHYGKIKDKTEEIDEVLVSVMREPKTFTAEDTVEINAHGSLATTKKILELLLLNGARLAEAGEFTKRAFLNGRIDLTQAEGVMDLISAQTENARKLSMNEVTGKVSNKIRDLREKLVSLLTAIEVNIDYPEYEENTDITHDMIKEKILDFKVDLKDLIDKSENGQIIKTGIKTSIIGKPNVGKSSLLNALLEEEKAIVTEIAGTTRDTVEGSIILDGMILNILDTAGIRKTDDVVEAIGVKKSLDLIDASDLILYVIDNNVPLDNEDKETLNKLQNKKHIIIINKIDLESKIDLNVFDKEKTVFLSLKENKGIDELKEKIKQLFDNEEISKDLTYLTNTRSISLLKEAYSKLEEAEESVENKVPTDIIELDIKEIWNKLGNIIGEVYEEELLDELFNRFCLGK